MLLLALLFALMALAQLGSFEEYRTALQAYGLTSGNGSTTLALIIAAVEILSLPVLLRLSISPLMRSLSLASIVLVPLLWLLLTLVAAVNGGNLANPGYFGGFLVQPFTPIASFFWGALLVACAGIVYSLCTSEKRSKR